MSNETNAPEAADIYWSVNGEDFTFGSVQELLGCYDEKKAGDVVEYGEAYHPDPIGWVDSDDVIEMLAERAYDDCGEWAGDYMEGTSKDARRELDELLAGWYLKHATPSFYKIKNETKYTLTQADIDEANALGTAK